jgi:hypothetical protein
MTIILAFKKQSYLNRKPSPLNMKTFILCISLYMHILQIKTKINYEIEKYE